MVTAEYPGRLCQLADASLYGCTSLFLQGFGGDAKSAWAVADDGRGFAPATFADVDAMASSMFEAVRKTLQAGAFTPVTMRLAGRRFTVPLALDVLPLAHYQRQAEQEAQPSFLRDCARYVVDHYDALPERLELHASILRLCDDRFVFSLGGEPSYDVGVVLRGAFPDMKVICVGYADDSAYIPSDRMIAEGGYEAEGSVVEYRLKGRIAPGVDEALVRGFREAMRSLEGT